MVVLGMVVLGLVILGLVQVPVKVLSHQFEATKLIQPDVRIEPMEGLEFSHFSVDF
jgi:hypothetical protein